MIVGNSLSSLFLRMRKYGQISLSFPSGSFPTSPIHLDPWAKVVLLFIVDLIIEVLVKRVIEDSLAFFSSFSITFDRFYFVPSSKNDSGTSLFPWVITSLVHKIITFNSSKWQKITNKTHSRSN